jgi:hypothetical protein
VEAYSYTDMEPAAAVLACAPLDVEVRVAPYPSANMAPSPPVLAQPLLAYAPTVGDTSPGKDTSIMPPTDEARFIALWQQGLSHEAMAQRLGCPVGTVKSRSYTLVHQGKIQPRQPGRAVPQQTAPARQKRAPVQRPPAPPTGDAPPAPPAMTFVAVPELQEMFELLRNLNIRVEGLEQARVAPALPAAPATPTTPTPPAAERKDIQQWTVRLSKALIEHIKAVAYERRLNPS